MKLNYKTTVTGLALGCLFAANVQAAPQNQDENSTSDAGAVLFRIENIKPIQNKDGLTDQCSYTVTVYNRMDKGLQTADIRFEWIDKISGKYKIDENQITAVEGANAELHIVKEMTVDNVAPHSQKSFTQKVNTDKCYLLLDNLQYVVKSCSLEGQKVQYKDGKAVADNGCAKNFNYIDSKNPEYYSEFRDVPASSLAKQVEEEKERELSKVNATIDSIMNTLDATNGELEKIR